MQMKTAVLRIGTPRSTYGGSMFEIKGLKTFAMSAKDLPKAEAFYTRVLGGEVVRSITPDEEQLNSGDCSTCSGGLGILEHDSSANDGQIAGHVERSGRAWVQPRHHELLEHLSLLKDGVEVED
jgi:catechol 2,3-dioxygenase-like lactoylglutathione lyase family enzyme